MTGEFLLLAKRELGGRLGVSVCGRGSLARKEAATAAHIEPPLVAQGTTGHDTFQPYSVLDERACL